MTYRDPFLDLLRAAEKVVAENQRLRLENERLRAWRPDTARTYVTGVALACAGLVCLVVAIGLFVLMGRWT